MGASTLRRKANLSEDAAMSDPKYAGEKTSRKDMFGDEDDEGLGEVEEDDEEDQDDQDDEEEGDKEKDYEEDDDEEDDDEEEDDEDDNEEEDDNDDDEGDKVVQYDNDDEDRVARNGAPNETQSLIDQVRSAQEKDAKKGRDVRKQIKAWEQALRMRISMQKLVTAASRMPAPSDVDDYENESPEAAASLRESADALDNLAGEILEARTALWKDNVPALANMDASGSTPERALESLETQISPYRRARLAQWSSKIAAAPGGGAAARLQLKAMNQNAVEQIDQTLSGDGLDRLVDRTRVWRSDEPRLSGGDESHPEVFDDNDFYSGLLRDLLDNAGLVEAGASASASNALGKKRKRQVDVRASKGRRIRYDVIERIQNFMPPVPRNFWNDEQSARLFSQLAGSEDSDDPAEEAPVVDSSDGFRLFG